MIHSELWWDYVPVGVSTKNEIFQQIVAGRCVLLNTSHLPWIDDLMRSIQIDIGVHDAELNWNVIYADEIIGYDPTKYLGSFFGVDQIPSTKLIQQQIRQIHTCCWVRNIPESETAAWIQLAKDLFSGKDKSSFRLVLELPSVTARGIGKTVVIDAKIERFDIYYFALSILASGRFDKGFREYASTLCAELAEGDVERCYALCSSIDNVLLDPLIACSASTDERRRKQLVCRAQTRSISPLIDIGRLKLITIFKNRVDYILPQMDDYGNELKDVSDVELRHLVYFSNNGLMTISHEEKRMLYCLYNARNMISHLDVLSYNRIKELFDTLNELSC